MILFLDTETTGLPRDWQAPVSDLDNWPRLVQIAWLIYDYNENLISTRDYLIKPDGFDIPFEASQIHGITTKKANILGRPLKEIVLEFAEIVKSSDLVVAHNIFFDEKILGAEFLRLKMDNTLADKAKICTMVASVDYCAIPGHHGHKWPKLSELHNKLFGNDFEEAHNAAVDVQAAAKCFWKLNELGVINLSNLRGNNEKVSGKIPDQKHVLDSYCEKNGFMEVPLGAKAHAIFFLESKFMQLENTKNVEEEFELLQWGRDVKKPGTHINFGITESQQLFLLDLKKRIIDEHRNFKFFRDKNDLGDKIAALRVLALVENNSTDEWILLVKHTYNYYVSLYFEFLQNALNPVK